MHRTARPGGRRDHATSATLFNTGARVQEILDLRASDLQLTALQLRLVGKGARSADAPYGLQTAQLLRAWCVEQQFDLR